MISSQTINNIKNVSLNLFDEVLYMGVSTDPEQNDTQIFSNEVDRFSIDEAIKTAPDTYEWETVIGLTEANGNTLQKVGFLKTETGDDLMVSEELPQDIEKTELIELNVGFKLTLSVTDNTWGGES